MSTVQSELSTEVFYPESDGQPMAETGIHVETMLELIGTLKRYYKAQTDVYVIGNIFLYYEEGHPESRRSPDCMVIKGVPPGHRRSFMTWKEGDRVPNVIFEITSAETAREDTETKHDLYERLKVPEYFLFDPLEDYLDQQLTGYRLRDGAYELLTPDEDGCIVSVELGLRLQPEGTRLRLRHAISGAVIPSPEEMHDLMMEAEASARRTRLALAESESNRVAELATSQSLVNLLEKVTSESAARERLLQQQLELWQRLEGLQRIRAEKSEAALEDLTNRVNGLVREIEHLKKNTPTPPPSEPA